MNGFLRQSTASQTRTIGPFVDDSDFKTLENALSISNTDIKIKANGAASSSKNSGGATADGSGGLYHLTWDATDTSAVGELSVSVKVAGALVYFCTYTVLEEVVYDALYAASAPGWTFTLSAGDLTDIADAVLKRDFSAVSGEAARSLLNAARFLRNKWGVAGATLTVTKEDDATTAWTSTLVTTPGAEPITSSDPA